MLLTDHEFRMVYQMTNSSQKLYYMIGQFDGWLLGPKVGENYGGIKNTHDGMCVQGNPGSVWGYYDGPTDMDNPEEAFPYWRFDDSSLAVSCVPRSVEITTEMVPDAARGPALVGVYRRVRPLLVAKMGAPPTALSTDKINIDLWTVKRMF